MNKDEIRLMLLELEDMCDIQMNKDEVHPAHRVGVYNQFDTMLRRIERSDNSDYVKCPLCKGLGVMPKANESNDIDIYTEDL